MLESDDEEFVEGDWEDERTPLTGGRERPLESREPDDLCLEALRRAVGGAAGEGLAAGVLAAAVVVVVGGDAEDWGIELWRAGAEVVLAREEGRGGGTKGSCDAGGGLLSRRERRRAAAAAAAPSSSLLVAVRDARLPDETESEWCFK